MKNWLFIELLLLVFCTSCFEDESNLDIRALNPIVIENIDESARYSLYMGDTLKIEPLVYCEGIPDAELSFEWKLIGGSIVPTVLDSTMYLCAQIVAPSSSSEYTLRFTVTDRTTGISRIETYPVMVLNPYGEGLLVAYTRDDQNTDLALLMSKEFSDDISKDDDKQRIFRDLWSQNNGSPMSGLALDAMTNNYSNPSNPSLTVLTTDKIYRASHQDFVNIPGECDALLWHVVPPHIGHGYTHGKFAMNSSIGTEILSANGYITTRSIRSANRMFSYTLYPAGWTEYDVTLMWADSRDRTMTYCYDAMHEQMLFYAGTSGLFPAAGQAAVGSPFDVRDLSEYKPFFLGRMKSGVALLATEKNNPNSYKALIMECVNSALETNTYAKEIKDFSSATNISSAKYFALNSKEDVIFYATETELYALPTSSNDAVVQWTVEPGSGDIITGIRIYDWGGGSRNHEDIDNSGRSNKVSWGSSGNMMIVYTYNEASKEGKVICVPIKTIGIGGMEQNRLFHTTFRGLGKILGVYKQTK